MQQLQSARRGGALAVLFGVLCAAASLHSAAAQPYSWSNLKSCTELQNAAEQILSLMTDSYNRKFGMFRKYTLTLACPTVGTAFFDCVPKNRTASNAVLFFTGAGRVFIQSAPGCSFTPTLRAIGADGARLLHVDNFKVRVNVRNVNFDGMGNRPGILVDTAAPLTLEGVTVSNTFVNNCPIARPYPRAGNFSGNSSGLASATACGAGMLVLSTSVILRNCKFINSVASYPYDGDGWGAGIYIDASTKYLWDKPFPWVGRILLATGTTFEGGVATVGGGIFMYKTTKWGTSMRLKTCQFNKNAGIGSAIATVRSDEYSIGSAIFPGYRITMWLGSGMAAGPKFTGNTGPSLLAGFRDPPYGRITRNTKIYPNVIFFADRRPTSYSDVFPTPNDYLIVAIAAKVGSNEGGA